MLFPPFCHFICFLAFKSGIHISDLSFIILLAHKLVPLPPAFFYMVVSTRYVYLLILGSFCSIQKRILKGAIDAIKIQLYTLYSVQVLKLVFLTLRIVRVCKLLLGNELKALLGFHIPFHHHSVSESETKLSALLTFQRGKVCICSLKCY